jgi:hypothetical protein
MADEKQSRVLVEVTISAPIDQVWRALRDPEQIDKWFGWDADTLKDEIDLIFLSEATKADEATHTIAFGEWEGTADSFVLEPRGNATLLRVVRSGPAAALTWDDVYSEVAEGWISFVQQLRLYIEDHKDEVRRTIYLSGKAAPDQALPSDALGLTEAKGKAIGSAYNASVINETLDGMLYHRSRFQTGFTVAEWGNGLLVVTDRPEGPGAPNGGGSVILTTYGLDELAFAALRDRWSEWWEAHYPKPAADSQSGAT